MINNRIIHFEHKDTFDEQNELNNVSDLSIVFIKDSCTVRTHSQDYNFINWSILTEDVPQGYEKFITEDGLKFSALDGSFYVKN